MASVLASNGQVLYGEIESLVDLFLSPDFEPLSNTRRRGQPEAGFEYESEVVDDVADCADQNNTVTHQSRNAQNHLKECGRKLAKFGDEYFRSKQTVITEAARSTPVSPMEMLKISLMSAANDGNQGMDPARKERENREAWDKFKSFMEKSVSDTLVKDAYQGFGAFLLTVKGLSILGSETKSLIRRFSLRYIREKQLDKDIEKMGRRVQA